ncbi:hypothetical protein LMG31884_39640 [Xanthomonas hydrangeae]|uniref:hypothetical protein n=1 Tax=Xanthomonas hydrangeae TaxID=2775159 RepID=UPI001AF8F234|nr:hypothetical protein LMG31884_39640 [Xanthomonas hydrangeae]CAD7726456.1 hypothetical protein LMG31884_39640 [Xanthomonas hydrangeae]CAD7742597.1 hypothetical protein LMG31887_39560 [Xanthomonas hydrangeae]CAD7742600.1 hypothetical protein LMG31887_39560 [Xanthomonas hydrangeae]
MNTNTATTRDISSEANEAATKPSTPCDVRARYEAAAQALSEALARKKVMADRATTMSRAGDAAQVEADTVQQLWRGLLRDADGTLTREVQKLRAAERSALTLVEEYAAMHQEIRAQMDGMELEVAELAARGIGLRDEVLEVASREAFDTLMAKAGDTMAVAYELHRCAVSSSTMVRMQPSDEQLLADFLHRIGQQINARCDAVGELVGEAIGAQKLELDGVDMALARSPLRRSMLNVA